MDKELRSVESWCIFIACLYQRKYIITQTISYYLAHAHIVNRPLIYILHHIHGRDDGQIATGGYLPEGVAHILTHLADVATGGLFLVGLEDGEQVIGGGRIAICNFLHGGIPCDSDTRRICHL